MTAERMRSLIAASSSFTIPNGFTGAWSPRGEVAETCPGAIAAEGAANERAPRGAEASRGGETDPRRAIDLRVRFPSQRSNRSGFAPDARGCVRGREAVAGGRTDADPMLARSKERKSQLSVFRDCPALAMGVIFFRFTTQRAVGFSESEKAGGARRDETSASARFGREGEFRVTGARAEAAAGPERLPRLPRRFTRVRRIDAPLHAKAGAARPHDRSR